MFHLNNRQLHMLFIFFFLSVLVIGGIFIFSNRRSVVLRGNISGLENFSEGWVATYDTLDVAKWRKYGNTDDTSGKKMVTEVINLPNSFDIKADKYVTLTHRIPDFSEDNIYMVFDSKDQIIEVSADKDILYVSDGEDISFPYHVIPIDRQYRDGNIIIRVKRTDKDKVTFDSVRIGNYTKLMSAAVKENGWLVLVGALLVILSCGISIIGISLKVEYTKKLMLKYVGVESFFAGILFIIESRLFQNFIRWEMLNYFMRTAFIILTTVAHLLVVRCHIRKPRILTVVDFGILFYCIEFISVMVLQWFGLLSFERIHFIAAVLSFAGLVIYTLLIGSASYDYKQREEKPVFLSNIILVCAAVIQIVLVIIHSEEAASAIPLAVGCIFYFVILTVYGMRKAVQVTEVAHDPDDDRMIITEQVIDKFNPNLLFASFQSLQNLIKNGSENSTKMIYYISVYVMNNLKAMSSQGEIIPFNSELEHIMAYLQLQRTRNSSLSFAIESKVKDFKIPRNTIEPLVENAVKYGIGGKNDKGNVVVRSYERQDGYAIQIIDDGIGFDVKSLKNTGGDSAKNIFSILESKCKAKTEIISKEGKGTVITILLPMIENELL